MPQRPLVFLLNVLLAVAAASAQTPPESSPATPPPAEDASTPQSAPAEADAPSQPVSDAERIARLQRSVERLRKRLDDLRAQLNEPESEYAKAEAEFTALDGQLQTRKDVLQKLRDEGAEAAATTQEAALQDLAAQWKLAKDRFELAIQAHKALQEQVATLEQTVQRNVEKLKKLKSETEAAPASQPGPAPAAAPPASAAAPPPESAPGAAAVEGPAGASGPSSATQPDSGVPAVPPEELRRAREQAAQRQAEAEQAQEEAASITGRIDSLQKGIALEQKQLETARQQADNAQESERTFYTELQRKSQAGAAPADLQDLRQKIADTRERFGSARSETRERTERINRLQSRLTALQAEQIGALQQAQRKQLAAEAARRQVAQLENPFNPRNLLQWALLHGPRIFGILVGMYLILRVSRLLERRVVALMTFRGDHGTKEERENRARTLLGVFHNALRVAVIPAGLFMILTELGMNIVPLLGGAAVAGLAVAFGAQNLLRDYFTGFMILLENQYAVNDVVKIADISGLVERVTLRLTVLRDMEGTVHFIPNGHITTVSNLTHGWSRAVFDIGVAYKEDVDNVMEVLTALGTDLRRDPEFKDLILADPEMLGVDQLGDSAIVIKFFIKTRPMTQWTVKREMLRRIKKRFDELGIEIPYPHRTVYHRYEDGAKPAGPDTEKGVPS